MRRIILLVFIVPAFYILLAGCEKKSEFITYDVRFQGVACEVRLEAKGGRGVTVAKIAEESKIGEGATIAVIPLKFLVDGNPNTADATITIPKSEWGTNHISSGAIVHFLPH